MRFDAHHSVPCALALLAMGWQAQARAQQAGQTALPGAASPAAQQTGYVDLMGGMLYTDNALLTSSHRTSDGIGTLGVNADYRRQGNLSLDLLGNVDRLQYVRNSYGGSFYGNFFGTGILGKPTNVLQWQLSDSFGEEMSDPLASPTPQNLQTINDVSTGPLVNLHFGLTNRVTLFGLYSRTTYQRSPFDSQTYQGGAQFSHELSGASSLSLAASTAHTKYIDSATVSSLFNGRSAVYDIRRASISYKSTDLRTTILLRAGYNTLRYGGAARRGAPLYEIRLSRRVTPFSTLFVAGRQTYSSNGGSLGSPSARIGLQVGAALHPGFAVAQPFNERVADAGWLFNRARTSLSLTGSYRQTVFDQTGTTITDYNHRDEVASIVLGRQLRPTMRVQLRAEGYWVRYSQFDARTRRETVRLTFSERFVHTMIWLYVERRHQSGSAGTSGFFASSYNDDRAGLYVTYDLFGARPMQQNLQGMPGIGGFAGGY